MPRNKPNTGIINKRHTKSKIDYYPTPDWATEVLCEWLINELDYPLHKHSCLEPAAGGGHMVRVLERYFDRVTGKDAYNPDPDVTWEQEDFLMSYDSSHDWIITNPPFSLAKEFVLHALDMDPYGVAMLARLSLLEGKDRYRDLFSKHPPSHVLVFVNRLPMTAGKIDESVSSAVAMAWFVWVPWSTYKPPGIHWVTKPVDDRQEEIKMGV